MLRLANAKGYLFNKSAETLSLCIFIIFLTQEHAGDGDNYGIFCIIIYVDSILFSQGEVQKRSTGRAGPSAVAGTIL